MPAMTDPELAAQPFSEGPDRLETQLVDLLRQAQFDGGPDQAADPGIESACLPALSTASARASWSAGAPRSPPFRCWATTWNGFSAAREWSRRIPDPVEPPSYGVAGALPAR